MKTIPFLYFMVLTLGIVAGIFLDYSLEMKDRFETQGALDASVVAGTAQQRQVVVEQDEFGSATKWFYEVDPVPALAVAQQTWQKNLSHTSKHLSQASFVGPTFTLPNNRSVKGNVTLIMSSTAEKKAFQSLFQSVPNSVTTTIPAPVTARSEIPLKLYP